MEEMQMFVSQPSYEEYGWEVARYNEAQQNYVPLNGENYPTEMQAKGSAAELNQQYEDEKQLVEEGGKL